MRKLGIAEATSVAVLGDREGVADLMAALPEGVLVLRRRGRRPDIVVFFARRQARLRERIGDLAAAVHPDRALWVAWPKRTSGVTTDLTEDAVRDLCLPTGLVDVKVAAINDTWSGLKLLWSRSLR